jgi:hypothetical protein
MLGLVRGLEGSQVGSKGANTDNGFDGSSELLLVGLLDGFANLNVGMMLGYTVGQKDTPY